MKFLLSLSIIALSFLSLNGQDLNPNYDEALATKVGADDYGMKGYIFVILKSGTNETTDKVFRDSCFAGHMKNIQHLVDLNKLIVAGPIGKNDNSYRGIFILNTTDMKEANEMLQMDPAITSNLLAVDLYNWYGAAALSEYLKYSEKVNKFQF